MILWCYSQVPCRPMF